MAVRQFSRTLAREREHGADPAVDVDPRVVLGRAGPVGQLVELRFEIEQPLGERLQERGPLMECHQPKRRAAAASCVRQDLAEVDAAGGGLGDQLPGRCIAQCGARAVGRVPASGDVAFEFHAPPSPPRGGLARIGKFRPTLRASAAVVPASSTEAPASARSPGCRRARRPRPRCRRRTWGRPAIAGTRSRCTRWRRCLPDSPQNPARESALPR